MRKSSTEVIPKPTKGRTLVKSLGVVVVEVEIATGG